MKKKYLFFYFLLVTTAVFSQFVPTYYPILASSGGSKGNMSLYYRLYTGSTSANPNTSADFDVSYTNSTNYKSAGYVPLYANVGNLNTSLNGAVNILNFSSFTQLTTAIGNATPYAGFNGQGYSIVISGYFIPKQTGTYTFSIEGDDAVELFLNNVNVVNHYGPHAFSAVGTHTGTISLIAGKKYVFRTKMQQGYGGDALFLFWKKPSESGGSVWYQDIEELSGEEVVQNGLVLSTDPANWYVYPKYGNILYDVKGNANGAINGTMSFSDTNGGLFYDNGNQDYIDFGKTPTNFPTTDISVFLWVKGSSFRDGWNILLTKWFDAAGVGVNSDFHYAIRTNNGVNYQNLFTTNGTNMFGAIPISVNNWYYLGFTISNNNMQMYLNATLDGAVRTNAARTNNTQANLWLGDARTGNVNNFNGYIGSLNIYNRAISADEVLQNFNATKHRYGL